MLQVFFIAFFFCLLFNVSLISVCTNSSLKHNLSFGFLCFEKLSSSQYHSLSFLTSFKFHSLPSFLQSKMLPLREFFFGSRAVAFCGGAFLGQMFRCAHLDLLVVTMLSSGPVMPKEGMAPLPRQGPRFLFLKAESLDQQHQQSSESLVKMQNQGFTPDTLNLDLLITRYMFDDPGIDSLCSARELLERSNSY